jgi:hypothetical protein
MAGPTNGMRQGKLASVFGVWKKPNLLLGAGN